MEENRSGAYKVIVWLLLILTVTPVMLGVAFIFSWMESLNFAPVYVLTIPLLIFLDFFFHLVFFVYGEHLK